MAIDAVGDSPVWDAAAIIAACPRRRWVGDVWRMHTNRYAADDAAGSLKVSGRYHRGNDEHGPSDLPAPYSWAALYTARTEAIALAERVRHTSAAALQKLSRQRVSTLFVELQEVIIGCDLPSCSAPGFRGAAFDDICHDHDYAKPQALAWHARQHGEALLVPSCTGFNGGNLVIFPDRLRSQSSVTIVRSFDPRLVRAAEGDQSHET